MDHNRQTQATQNLPPHAERYESNLVEQMRGFLALSGRGGVIRGGSRKDGRTPLGLFYARAHPPPEAKVHQEKWRLSARWPQHFMMVAPRS